MTGCCCIGNGFFVLIDQQAEYGEEKQRGKVKNRGDAKADGEKARAQWTKYIAHECSTVRYAIGGSAFCFRNKIGNDGVGTWYHHADAETVQCAQNAEGNDVRGSELAKKTYGTEQGSCSKNALMRDIFADEAH